MCEQCIESWNLFKPQLRRWFGDDLDNKAGEIMFTYTGYPITDPVSVHEDLAYLAEHGPAAASQRLTADWDEKMKRAKEKDR